jgi:hypothetical protein
MPRRAARDLFLAGLAAVGVVGCADHRLERANRQMRNDVGDLMVIANDLERLREARASSIDYRERLRRWLERTGAELDEAGRSAGLRVESRSSGEATAVRFALDGPAQAALQRLRGIQVPPGARLREVHCTPGGCGLTLSAPSPELVFRRGRERTRRGAASARAQCEFDPPLPPRPVWPPYRAQWARVRAAQEECRRLREAVGEVADVRRVLEEMKWLSDLMTTDRPKDSLFRAADRVREAGARTFQVEATAEGLQVDAPGAGAGLEAALESEGAVHCAGDTCTIARPAVRGAVRSIP